LEAISNAGREDGLGASGGGSGSGAIPNIPIPDVAAPNPQLEGDNGINQLQDTINSQNQNTRAYVVSSDVTSQQEVDRLTQEQSML